MTAVRRGEPKVNLPFLIGLVVVEAHIIDGVVVDHLLTLLEAVFFEVLVAIDWLAHWQVIKRVLHDKLIITNKTNTALQAPKSIYLCGVGLGPNKSDIASLIYIPA